MAPRHTPRGGDVIARALQQYADRGVFRGFSGTPARPARHGLWEFRFVWLSRHAMTVRYDERAATLTFRDLLPDAGADPGMVAVIATVVGDHLGRAVPPHRRIDARRVRVRCSVRRRHLSLAFSVRGAHHAYAVQRGLNLVNQLFLALQERYPDYLVETMGFSSE